MVKVALLFLVTVLAACSSPGSATAPQVSRTAASGPAASSSARISPPAGQASAFAGAKAVAIAGAVKLTGARYLPGATDVSTGCPADAPKCLALLNEVDGVQAAYFQAYLGSAAEYAMCGIYTVHDQAAWRFLDMGCDARESGQQWPDVGSVDYIFNVGASCANVRATPGLTGRIVGCLKDGTTVNVDGGPVYVIEANPAASHLWWHLQGVGWMAHDYLLLLYV